MRTVMRFICAIALAAAGAIVSVPAPATAAPAAPAVSDAKPGFRVLVFTKTAGERRSSIKDGVEAIRELGKQDGFAVEATDDATRFTDEVLQRFRAVVFLNTTGDVLNDAQQAAFERYFKDGGGFLGIHSAAETEPNWEFY